MANLENGIATENANVKAPITENDATATTGADAIVEGQNASGFKSHKQILAELMAKGCQKRVGIRVRSANVTEKDTYTMVSLSLDKAINGYKSDDNGVFVKGEVTTVYASAFSIASVLKESDETAWAANQLVRNPKGLEVVLAGAKVDIIQEEISAGEVYKNPFSTNNNEGTAFDHDTYINHIAKIEISPVAKKMLNMLAMNMMGM